MDTKANNRKACIKKLYDLLEEKEKEIDILKTGNKNIQNHFELSVRKQKLENIIKNKQNI